MSDTIIRDGIRIPVSKFKFRGLLSGLKYLHPKTQKPVIEFKRVTTHRHFISDKGAVSHCNKLQSNLTEYLKSQYTDIAVEINCSSRSWTPRHGMQFTFTFKLTEKLDALGYGRLLTIAEVLADPTNDLTHPQPVAS